LDANEYWLAEPLLKKALAKADKFNPKDIRLAKSLGELGRLCTIRGRYDEAGAYLEEQLAVEKEVWANDKAKCIPTMGSLIRFYLIHGTQDQALPFSAEMLYFVEGKLDEAKEGSIKNKLQKGQPLQGWLGSAAPVAITPALEWAVACDAVGNSYLTVSNYVLADRFFRAALDLKTTILGKNHLSLANSYDSLAGLYLEKKDLAEAESYFADALEITEKTLSPESREAYNRLDKLAKCYIQEGKYSQAEALYQRAQTYWKKDGSAGAEEARALYALGSLYSQEHKYEAAEPLLQQALQLAEKFNGPDSITVVPYLQKYAYVLYYLGRKPEMEQLHARVNTISDASM
jgi:tetratricopeptide (TPR) repeat protein